MQKELTPPIAEAAQTPPQVVDIGTLATQIAEEHHLNVDHFKTVVNCESQWNITAVGDGGLAHGLVQIRSDYHPDVTIQEADDPTFALEFMANAWENGQQSQWSCWRMNFGT